MTLSPIPRRSGRLLSTAVAVGLAVTAGPLTVPAFAAAPAAFAAPAPAASAGKLAPGSRIVSAGTTGYLSADPEGTVVWTRYADGGTTQLARDKADYGFGTEHGTASDTVALGDDPVMGASKKITLRDMATGKSAFIDLATYGYHYMGTVGSSVFAYKRVGKDEKDQEVHLLAADGEKITDRVVTGLPAGSNDFHLEAGGPGKAVVRCGRQFGEFFDYVVVDLASAKAVPGRSLASGYTAGAAVSAKHLAVSGSVFMSDPRVELETVELAGDGDGRRWSTGLEGMVTPHVGLVGDWAVYGEKQKTTEGRYNGDLSVRAVPVGGGTGRKVLDHLDSLTPTPDGALLVTGGTVEQGEGLYRISAGADGAPVAQLVASTGEPTKVTLTDAQVPAVADLSKGHWKPRWQLSRRNVEVTITLRHRASGAEHAFTVRPDDAGPSHSGPGWVDFDWDGVFDGWPDKPAAPNGDYTWKFSAKPRNNLGPVLESSGTFEVTRKPAPHDYTDNGTPDLLVRGPSTLSIVDTFRDGGRLKGMRSKEVGTGWGDYHQVTAAGEVAGAPAGDLVARDKDGVLWLYLGKGDGTFTDRVKIGGGWDMYDRITGGADLDGDGRGDLLARDSAGALWFYKGTGDWRAPFAPRVKAGTGWTMYNEITSVGDVAGGPGGDLVARDPNGVLWLYLGYGNGTFADRVKIGPGWDAYRQTVGIGDANADGKADLFVTTKEDRTTYVYHGTGDWRAPFAAREATGIEVWTGDTVS
ncbi:VCBS repeat-containing protein [Streptomyces albofaciens JCM 4342]|uniref:FG-GAP repeat domain-containing protein n=1 Tax=Streptomyces albofaciens TaxID=66866 RepID=UPI00123A1042|nr:VCBS repeat-containing protein [Streptomyces albofaciens]KAA6213126.1 VCBS repeat-containing protein [Streptomyces albofaciens JCM 4342]